MARKTSKKKTVKKAPSRRPAPRSATTRGGAKPAKKASRKPPARASAPKRKNPAPVTTGRGPTPAEIGADLVAMFNRGEMTEIERKWHSPNLVSVEGIGVAMAWTGQKAVREKNEWWMSTHRLHAASAEGPYVGASGFAVKFAMDVEDITSNTRSLMEEIGVYTVENGKIVREEFMYGSSTPVTGAGE